MSDTLNFGTIRQARIAEWLNSFVSLPAFSYGGIIWKGASEIVTQFNYTATKNFTIRTLPEPPANVNFCLVIRYRIGLITYRYKLWAGVGETLNETLYNGEVIKKNFVLEIWNTQQSLEVSSLEAIIVNLSIRKIPHTYINLDDYADNELVAEAPNQLISGPSVALPTTGLLANYRPENLIVVGPNVTAWNDLVGGFNLATFAGTSTFIDNALNGYDGVRFSGSGILEGNSPFSSLGAAGVNLIFVVCKQNTWTDNDTIFAIVDPNPTDTQGVQQRGTSPEIKALMRSTYSGPNNLLPVGNYDVIKYIGNLNILTAFVSILGSGEVNTGIVAGTTQGTKFRVGSADVTLVEVLCYNGALFTDYDSVFQYLLGKYGLGVVLPMTVDSANKWLDNT